jgi:hypothetical protein
MDPLLLALTIVSLISAAGFGGFAWHLLREERRRSAARVAALSSAIDAAAPPPRPVGVADLFASAPSTAGRGHGLIRGAAALVMAVVVVLAVASANRRAPTDGGPGEVRAAPAAARAGAAPLELISMRHTRHDGTLTVTGLVRNPRAGAAMTRVEAVVLAFNRAGAFAASGRAPLDFTTLEPGDESPFVVTIPSVSEVGRYRVSFRTEAGVVRHVDRRQDQSRLAAAELR